jgi:hypothetical protein
VSGRQPTLSTRVMSKRRRPARPRRDLARNTARAPGTNACALQLASTSMRQRIWRGRRTIRANVVGAFITSLGGSTPTGACAPVGDDVAGSRMSGALTRRTAKGVAAVRAATNDHALGHVGDDSAPHPTRSDKYVLKSMCAPTDLVTPVLKGTRIRERARRVSMAAPRPLCPRHARRARAPSTGVDAASRRLDRSIAEQR